VVEIGERKVRIRFGARFDRRDRMLRPILLLQDVNRAAVAVCMPPPHVPSITISVFGSVKPER
jgi:hypothetical protein